MGEKLTPAEIKEWREKGLFKCLYRVPERNGTFTCTCLAPSCPRQCDADAQSPQCIWVVTEDQVEGRWTMPLGIPGPFITKGTYDGTHSA